MILSFLFSRDSLELSLPEDLHPSEILKRKLSVLLPTHPNTTSSTYNEYKGNHTHIHLPPPPPFTYSSSLHLLLLPSLPATATATILSTNVVVTFKKK